MNNYITFKINNQVMGVDMLNVEKVIKISKISSIPNSKYYLEGIIDFQDNLIPLINLKKMLNLEDHDVLAQSSVIVITDNNESFGIIVDSVNDIITIEEDKIVKIFDNKSIYGVVKVENDIVNLLNPEGVCLDAKAG